MHLQLKERLITQECIDLTQLATKASRIEHFLLGKEQRKAILVGKRPHLVTISDNDYLMEATNLSKEQLVDVMVVEIQKWRAYLCPTLRPLKEKEIAKSESKEGYLFDILRLIRFLIIY